MAKWKCKCIRCGKTNPVVCNLCHRKQFIGKKQKWKPTYLPDHLNRGFFGPSPAQRSDHVFELWLECLYCKETTKSHSCPECGASNDLNRFRNRFTKKQFSSSSSWLPFLLYLIIFVVIFYLFFPSRFN